MLQGKEKKKNTKNHKTTTHGSESTNQINKKYKPNPQIKNQRGKRAYLQTETLI
jgi:hypothetical protein